MELYRNLVVSGCFLVIMMLVGCQSSQTGADAQKPATAPSSAVPSPEGQLAVPAAPQAAIPADAPVISVENPVHDFGQLGPGATVKCEFKFTNTGKSVLKIEHVQSTCGCTVPELKIKEYAPGETGVISVSFHAPSVKGSVTKHLYIVSNAPVTPRAELAIKADVVVKVEISPEQVELRLDQPNAGMPDIVVKSADGVEFSIQSISIANNVITVPFDSAKKAKEFTLKPVVDIEKISEFNTGVIQVTTNHPQAGTLLVRYNAKPQYEVSRPRIILQNVEPGVAIVKDVLIRSNYGKQVEMTSAQSQKGLMEIESQEKDGEHLKLMVKITPPVQEAPAKRYITDELDVTLKDGTKLTIRCSGWYKLK